MPTLKQTRNFKMKMNTWKKKSKTFKKNTNVQFNNYMILEEIFI